jgi:hypothetical protein
MMPTAIPFSTTVTILSACSSVKRSNTWSLLVSGLTGSTYKSSFSAVARDEPNNSTLGKVAICDALITLEASGGTMR